VKLTPEEVGIMKEVRRLLQKAYNEPSQGHRQYICWKILHAINGRNTMYTGVSLGNQIKEAGATAERLYAHISWALRGLGTMQSFIEAETAHLGYAYSCWAGNFDAEARLAWLDRIIEMEDIK
jgi:hypothetical protein